MRAGTSCPTHGSQRWRSNEAASSSRPTGTTHAFPTYAGSTRWTSRGQVDVIALDLTHGRAPQLRIAPARFGHGRGGGERAGRAARHCSRAALQERDGDLPARAGRSDRKSTRLNSSHVAISYAVFCLKKKKQKKPPSRVGQVGSHIRSV